MRFSLLPYKKTVKSYNSLGGNRKLLPMNNSKFSIVFAVFANINRLSFLDSRFYCLLISKLFKEVPDVFGITKTCCKLSFQLIS